jgi:RNA polymerase sigma-70 factor (ECF subfamily)
MTTLRVASSSSPRPVLVDDASLARAVMQGQPNASHALWDRFSPFVRCLLIRIVGPDDELEDMVQDVFLRVHRGIGKLREPQAFRAFLMQITTHVAASTLRRRKVRRWLRLTDDGNVPEIAIDDAPSRAALAHLMKILDTLGTEERLAFVLHRVQELELTETASAMNVSLATVKRRLAEADERVATMASLDPLLRPYAEKSRGSADES